MYQMTDTEQSKSGFIHLYVDNFIEKTNYKFSCDSIGLSMGTR